ncbi:MAG: hypothetical protein GY895_11615 [Phycisphaera sp.]|nr:hypothetical protein [Phycisphaera sp.]
MRRLPALLLALIAPILFAGCEVDSFMNPSVTGYYEHTPTSMPILDRLDIIEQESGYQPEISKPTAEDLAPNQLQYRLAPGDIVRVEIYELVLAGQTDVSVRVIDQSGMIRLPTLGDVQAAGRTIEELQQEIIEAVRPLIPTNPLVTVVLEEGRSFQFTIYGSVSGTGIYALQRPDFRIMEALALAGGTAATTRKIFVIREVIIDENVRPDYDRGRNGAPASGQAPKADDLQDLDALIEALDGGASPAAMRSIQEEPQIDIDDLDPTDEANDQAPESTSNANGGNVFVFDEDKQQWVRLDSEAAIARGLKPSTRRTAIELPSQERNSPYATRIIEIDYQALARGDSNQNIVIRPDDRVFVDTPEVGVVYIDGEISRPGVYQLPIVGRLTLSRLVAAAGGLNQLAIPERVDLTRKVGDNREATLRVNLAAIRNRGEPDIYIRQDDYISIGTNFFAAPLAVIRNGFRFTYGFGFLLDRNFGNDVFGPPPTNFGDFN